VSNGAILPGANIEKKHGYFLQMQRDFIPFRIKNAACFRVDRLRFVLLFTS
jgi:hypothetical protein